MSGTERRRQPLLDGTVRVFLAEVLVVPTGIITVAFLTRKLGPQGYGLLAIAGTFVDWVEWAVTASFTRATVKFVSEAREWRPVAGRAIQLQFLASLGAGLLLWLLAAPISWLLSEPVLAHYLRLYSLDLPIFCLAQAHRDVLVGLGLFKERAIASGCRWVARLALIVLLVEMGLSIEGAILGGIASSLIELIICRLFVQPPLMGRSSFSARTLLRYVAPLSLFSLSKKLYDRLDLLALKALGGSAAGAGIYSAAQSLAMLPSIFAVAFAPLLLSSLGQSLREGDIQAARAKVRNALRAMMLLLPLAGMLAGMSRELVGLLFGEAFLPSAGLFNVLIFGSVALFIVSVITCQCSRHREHFFELR